MESDNHIFKQIPLTPKSMPQYLPQYGRLYILLYTHTGIHIHGINNIIYGVHNGLGTGWLVTVSLTPAEDCL